MNRFFGMMPSECIEISKSYKDENGLRIHIDAGKEGYTVRYADCSSEYADINATAEDNFKSAYNIASSHFKLTEVNTENCGECER